jgi:hypothetical protein
MMPKKYFENDEFSLFKKGFSVSPGYHPKTNFTESGIIYAQNDYGYRCDNFSKEKATQNFLFAGCSYTYGLGIPYEFTWAHKLNKDLGLKNFYNLSIPGRSFQIIVNDIYRYIRMFGKPKAVFAMFPNLERDHIVNFRSNQSLGTYYEVENVNLLHFSSKNTRIIFDSEEDFKKFQDYMKVEKMSYNFYNAIAALEDYLESLGVTFLWTTWAGRLAETLTGSGMFKNYFVLDFAGYEQYKKNNFYPPEELGKNRKYWLAAADTPNPHPGIMENEFFALNFLKKFDEIENF